VKVRVSASIPAACCPSSSPIRARVPQAGGDEALAALERWLDLAPFDQRPHAWLLAALAQRGRLPQGEVHLAATARRFAAEGLDDAPLRAAWRAARQQRARPLAIQAGPDPAPSAPAEERAATRRASIAVLPFTELGAAASPAGDAAGGLAHDVISRLAKLRSLLVIAQGTVFALAERGIGPDEAARMLAVDYVASGMLRRRGQRLVVAVELVETRATRIVWAETFEHPLDDTFLMLDQIGDRIVAAIASEIEANERNRALLKPPSSLTAWEAHHRGLWHMYRFNQVDNERARRLFEAALRLDPTFARAHAGLSFTHFQSAFQGWAARAPAVERAFAAAEQSLMADDRDPAAHWAMGRALWLRGRLDQSVAELEQAIELSPNFALGHYTLVFVHSQGGDAQAAVRFSDHSRQLSPFDPLLFGMLGARAMALVRLGQLEEAAAWAVKAAARPNAHAHILAIAAYSLALAGRMAEAGRYLAAIRERQPGYTIDDFLSAMQMAPDGADLFRAAARRLGQG
jgi:TolB-like protein/Tfp pilus assembly protein PilF